LSSAQPLSKKLNGKKLLEQKNAGLVGPADSCSLPCGKRLGSEVPADPLFLSVAAHITNARSSSSLCSTGIEQPDLSTRPTASRAASGDPPKPRPIRNS